MANRKVSVPRTQYRTATFDRASIDEKSRTVELAFSSEAPVERYFGVEILDHGPDAVRLDRVNTAGPLLFNHDRNAHIGRVERAWVEGKQGRAKVRFSNSPLGEEKFRDARDGILTEVSVGYRIHELVLEKSDKDAGETYRATSWEPHEISLVTMPADTSVGIGRATDGDPKDVFTITISERETMPPENTPAAPAAPAASVTVTEPDKAREAGIIAERNRVKAINDAARVLTERHPQHREALDAFARKCVETGDDVNAFNRGVLADVFKTDPVATPTRQADATVGLSKKDIARYSILRAVRQILDNKPLDGLERECSDELAKKLERQPKGFFMPDEVAHDRRNLRTLVSGDPTNGGFTVPETMLSSEFVTYLRNAAKVMGLGARFISGLTGDVSIPRQLSGATAYWVSETGSITQSNATFGQIVAKPRRLGTSVPYSKQFLAQTSLDADSFVINDSDEAIAVELDRVAIRGNGGAEPLGILNLAAADLAGTVTFGAAATWPKYLEFFQKLAEANTLGLGTPAYLTTPASAVKAQSKEKFTNGDEPIWTRDGKIGMFNAEWSNQFPSSGTQNQVIFGMWNEVLFLEWAGRDVVVDPYSGKKEGTVEITIQRLIDMVIRRTKSFARSTDSGAQ